MKNIYVLVFTVFFIAILTLGSCAKRGTINGGPKDTIAPKIVTTFPENYTTNFDGKEIKIVFNELIKIKDINKQLIISPPLKNKPIIIPQGSASKFISVKILDTLQPNTTYSLNFGQSITDNNEGNPYSQYRYVFSTGSYIDSLAIMGKIKDAIEMKPDNFVSVQLYDAQTFSDSTVYKEPPLYVTNTLDSLKLFALENLKAGDYYIIALKDKNNNYKFDPKQDKIGFLKNKITIPNDTVFELELFKEKTKFKVVKPTQETENKFFMGFEGNPKNAKILAKKGDENIPVIFTKFAQEKKDSIQLFIPKIEADSLEFIVEKDDFKKSFTSKLKKNIKEKDTLIVNLTHKGNLHFRDTLRLKTTLPLKNIDKSKISFINKDSVAVDFSFNYKEFEQEVLFNFKKDENQKYSLQLLPESIEDYLGNKNDTLNFSFSTRSLSDYGNLFVNLKSAKRFPLILEVLTSKGEVVAQAISKGERKLDFEALEPNIYTLRIIYDDNGNGIWDTGNYLEKRQAEEIQYFPTTIDIRANWNWDQDF
ncbi:MAG: Ig-like domain-containing protein [Flavobacterium sp.]|nr:Ig-like domain-containing protein [Flavobacterium sp.]